MRISVLSENHAGTFTRAEHGLSYLIEFDDKKILFDAGQSILFLDNARIMNIYIGNLDLVVLSHGHFDHGNGLEYISDYDLLCHPDCFIRRHHKSDRLNIGINFSREELARKFNLITSDVPYKISERIYFLGGIPRITAFESVSTNFTYADGTPDFVMDDSALAIILPQGLFIITGCGHSGIVNILEYAKKVTGIETIYGILGGFHLKETDTQLKETIKYLKINNVEHVMPSHCTELPALSAFYENFGIRQVKTGNILVF